MSTPIEDLVKDAVDDLVRSVPHRPGLADIALRKAARRRRTTRVAVAAGAALAVATVIPLGAGLVGGPAPQPSPGKQTHASAPQQKTATVDIDALKQGPPPAVPWSKDGDAYVGDALLGPPTAVHENPLVCKIDGGYAILEDGSSEQLYTLRGNERTTLSDRSKGLSGGLVVSPDGRRIAWTTTSVTTGVTTLNLADVRSGKITRQKQEPGAATGGFLSDDRILLHLPGQRGKTGHDDTIGIWNLRTNRIANWSRQDEILELVEVSANGELAILQSAQIGGWCSEVTEVATEKTLWKGCSPRGGGPSPEPVASAFSPDGRYVLGMRNGAYVVADARTGEAGLTAKIDAVTTHNPVWESEHSFVVTVWKDNHHEALVRCFVAGSCELASPVATFAEGRGAVDHEGFWPYATLR